MAREKDIVLKATLDSEQAEQGLKDLSQDTKALETNMDELDGAADKATGGMISGFTNAKKAIVGAVKSINTFGKAIKAAGIGLLIAGIAAVAAAFTNSEEGQNKFAKLMTQIGVITGNVLDIMEDLGKSILSLGKSFVKLVKGDFAGAKEAFSEVTESIGEAIDGVKNFGEETRKEIKIAGDLADARARADKIERRLIVDRAKADKERADLLEKAVDKDKFTTEERIKFLEDASKLEEEITDKEINLAKIRLQARVQENKLSGSTKEDLQEEAELRAQVIQLETSRLTKQKEVTSQIIGLRNEEKTAKETFINAEREALAQSEDEKIALLILKEQEKFDELVKKAEELKQPTEDLEKAKLISIQKIKDEAAAVADKKQKEADQKMLDQQQKTADLAKKIEKSKLDAAIELSALGIGLMVEGSNAAKALGIANAIISTYSGAAQVLDDTELPLFAKIAGVATVLATGFQQVRAVQQTQIPVLNVGGVTAGGNSAPVPQIQPPNFNVVGASPINQLTAAISSQQSQPIRAYVVANDVTTAQSIDRNIIKTSGLG